MQISEAAAGTPAPGAEPCRFPKLEECAHFHYERVHLPPGLRVTLHTDDGDQTAQHHRSHRAENSGEWFMIQVTSGDECWLLQRNLDNFKMLDAQLHQCIYDRRIFQLPDLSRECRDQDSLRATLKGYLERFSDIADNSVNCGPVLNWLQMDNRGHRLLVPSEESRSINTPAVAAAYSVRRYVSQARDELNLEVGDMISVIDMASPGESMWWRGKRGFQVGFFPQHCVHIIGDKIPRNMPLPPPVVGSLALSPIKPVLRKHGKLITFFRSFILNRPSRRRLKQSGILKERVFGCDLGEHLLNSGHDIPTVLKCCAEFIESHGIVDGIYRLSGVTSNIQKLRNAFDEDRIPNLYTEDILQDIHSVASLLKMYFRELPNPLCTYQLYQSFVNAVQGCNSGGRSSESDHDRLLRMREAVQKLPPPHYRTLDYLMRHLARVAKHGASTGMTTRNVAIVWAPNLLRCAELEVGGVAALQGVGVQAVVTEFLICYARLIFSDNLPDLDMDDPGGARSRPKSLAISTPTKLITLEEARNKHLNAMFKIKDKEGSYIEVGGGPGSLPKEYHTVIELPGGTRRKRGHRGNGGGAKRSPSGWRSFFTSSKTNSRVDDTEVAKDATVLTPISEKCVTESDLSDMKRKLRSVKSAESLTSGHSEDALAPLCALANKPPGHNRSVSHDSYFDTLQSTSRDNSEMSLLDLSEIQLNFELEESEMRIFSEDESLVNSPRVRNLPRARIEETTSIASGNPSPKKQARVVPTSPDSLSSRKRTRLEDQLSDIQYIDCATPDNMVCTMALVHHGAQSDGELCHEPPKTKSPRNSSHANQRQSLNLEQRPMPLSLSKSMTDTDLGRTFIDSSQLTTPQSPGYRQLTESPVTPPQQNDEEVKRHYENILTTISITYKSPAHSVQGSPKKTPDSVYENVSVSVERALVPTSSASLPYQQASQPDLYDDERRPKSMSALDDETNDSMTTLQPQFTSTSTQILDTGSLPNFSDSNQSSRSNIQYTPSTSGCLDDDRYQQLGLQGSTDFTLSEVMIQTSSDDLSQDDIPLSSLSMNNSPQISPCSDTLDKRKSPEPCDDESVYQQVKFFRRSIHEVNALLDDLKSSDLDDDSLEPDDNDNKAVDVRALTNRFEVVATPVKLVRDRSKDLPPCLRARNLKNQLKTRSLDEDEFKRELGSLPTRRLSMDESVVEVGYKTSSLPKRLNPPKKLESSESQLLDSLHRTHSSENLTGGPVVVVSEQDEEVKKRERIEKYKEERRKQLQDKYRSESFKEDKDVIISKLKLFKVRDESDTIKVRAAAFESVVANQWTSNDVQIRPRTTNNKLNEKRPHTYDARERGGMIDDRVQRTVDNKKDKTTPAYCIKDMKAIFESKSKQ